MVARLTPDQKAACSNHFGVNSIFPCYFGNHLHRRKRKHSAESVLKGGKITKSSKEMGNAVMLKDFVFPHCLLDVFGGRNQMDQVNSSRWRIKYKFISPSELYLF